MHAVIVDADVSYPPTSGKRLRTLHLMLRLAKRHRVTYIGRGDATQPEVAEARRFLGERDIETLIVDHPVPQKKGLAFYGRLAANLLSPLPYSVASHHSLPMRRMVEEYAAGHRVDLWQFEWLPYMGTLAQPAGTPRVVVAHNVETFISQRYFETAAAAASRWYLKRQWHKMQRFEHEHLPRASRVAA